jgi:hypothetical protein
MTSFNYSSAAPLLDSQKSLHTLFTTPLTRKQLDKQRSNGKYNITSQTTNSTSVTSKPVIVKMQGVVIRKNKKPVVFVNDSNTLKSSKVNSKLIVNTRKLTKSTYNVPVRVNQNTFKLKPGQQWNEADNKVVDQYKISPAKNIANKPGTTPVKSNTSTQ